MILDDINEPHRLYETFELPLDALIIPPTNMRRTDPADPELYELALSLQAQGQLQPVLVTWTDECYVLAVGFRRASAMIAFRGEMGFETIRATRIRPEEADTARLVENFVRKNPSTYEIAEYFAQLQRGEGGRIKMSMAQIAAVVGKSIEYVRALTRFFRELPAEIRSAWAEDRDQRFTFRALNDLVRLKHANDEAGIRRRIEQVLKLKPKRAPTTSYKPAEQCLQEAIAGVGIDQEHERPASKPRKYRLMAGAEIQKLESQMSRVGRERLSFHELSADVVLDLLQAIAGKAPPAQAIEIVTDIVISTTATTQTDEHATLSARDHVVET